MTFLNRKLVILGVLLAFSIHASADEKIVNYTYVGSDKKELKIRVVQVENGDYIPYLIENGTPKRIPSGQVGAPYLQFSTDEELERGVQGLFDAQETAAEGRKGITAHKSGERPTTASTLDKANDDFGDMENMEARAGRGTGSATRANPVGKAMTDFKKRVKAAGFSTPAAKRPDTNLPNRPRPGDNADTGTPRKLAPAGQGAIDASRAKPSQEDLLNGIAIEDEVPLATLPQLKPEEAPKEKAVPKLTPAQKKSNEAAARGAAAQRNYSNRFGGVDSVLNSDELPNNGKVERHRPIATRKAAQPTVKTEASKQVEASKQTEAPQAEFQDIFTIPHTLQNGKNAQIVVMAHDGALTAKLVVDGKERKLQREGSAAYGSSEPDHFRSFAELSNALPALLSNTKVDGKLPAIIDAGDERTAAAADQKSRIEQAVAAFNTAGKQAGVDQFTNKNKERKLNDLLDAAKKKRAEEGKAAAEKSETIAAAKGDRKTPKAKAFKPVLRSDDYNKIPFEATRAAFLKNNCSAPERAKTEPCRTILVRKKYFETLYDQIYEGNLKGDVMITKCAFLSYFTNAPEDKVVVTTENNVTTCSAPVRCVGEYYVDGKPFGKGKGVEFDSVASCSASKLTGKCPSAQRCVDDPSVTFKVVAPETPVLPLSAEDARELPGGSNAGSANTGAQKP